MPSASHRRRVQTLAKSGGIGYEQGMRPRFGLLQLFESPGERSQKQYYDENIELVDFADQVGLDEVWLAGRIARWWTGAALRKSGTGHTF